MQTRAAISALNDMMKEGFTTKIRILLPSLCTEHNIPTLATVIDTAATEVVKTNTLVGSTPNLMFNLGFQFDTPRSCMKAKSVAKEENISYVLFQTDSLTNLMFGLTNELSMDCFHGFASHKHANPLVTIDKDAVGQLMLNAIDSLHSSNKRIKIGVSGKHCSDPASIKYFDSLKVDFITCDVEDIAVAKVAAAQSHIANLIREFVASVVC
jgi:pyruvate,orthophosphate dikinase